MNSKKPPKFILNVLYENKDKIWISKRSNNLKVMPGLWQTVCEKVEANESSIKACKRETTEETGLDLPSEKMKFIFNDRKYDCDVYVTKIRSD